MDIILRRIGILLLTLLGVVSLHAGTVNLNFFVGSTKIHTEAVTEGGTYTLSTIISEAGINMSSYQCRDYVFQGWKVGQPVEGTETPTMPTTVTPTDNMNLYAVFKHTDDSKVNNFIRITTTDNLEANAEYLIICYYVYGGEQQYYAMTNEKGTYFYETTCRNRLDAMRVYPRGGVIIPKAGEEGIIWTLSGTSGAWKWYNENADNWLRIGGTDQEMLVSAEGSASSCAITQANGIFTIRNTANSKILKYVDDYITEEEDYFITGDYTDYVIYLYKRESAYTSYPDCDSWTVHLDALDGTIKGKNYSDTTITQVSPDDMVTLPEAEVTGLDCGGWEFVGWSLDAPIHSSTTAPEHIIPAGEYDPLYNGVTLYAIYSKTETVMGYKRISSLSELSANDKCLITNASENKAVSTEWTGNKAAYPMVSVSSSGGIITTAAAAAAGSIEWTYTTDGSGNGHFVDASSNKLAYNRSNNYWYQVYDNSDYFILWYYYYDYWTWGSNHYWYLYIDGNYTKEDDGDEYEPSHYATYGEEYQFQIFKKQLVTTTAYTAYPHCTPYKVYLHACGGNINGEANVTKEQVTATSSIEIPSATPACPAEGWEFVGWFRGEDKESFEHVEFTDFVAGGSDFIPDHDETHLYAIYRRITDRFRIIDGVADIVDGDTYIVTFYKKKDSEKYYDYVLSSQVVDGTLKGLEYQSPRDGTGFYLDISDSTGMWTINKVSSYYTFLNLDNNQYLRITSSGTTTTAGANQVYLNDKSGTDWAIYISDRTPVNTSSYELQCPEGKYITVRSTSSGYSHCYIYRRIKEYSSWPHCEPFTVLFDAVGGTTEDDGTEKTEEKVYDGIELPDAYANADCSKEGWSFAGWATEPVNEETDLQTFDLYPAGTIYHPLATNTTLYAVYQNKTNHFKRITTVGRLHTGTKYIITTSDNKALANMPNSDVSPTAITYTTFTPDAAQIITVDNPAIEWRLEGVRGAYQLYNAARDVYLDLSEPAEAHLTKTTPVDTFDIIYENSAYLVRSCINTAHYDGNKFLGLNADGTYFTAIDSSKVKSRLKIYRQQATYCSNPNCTDDIDVIKWAKVDEEFNTVTVESYHLKGTPDVHGSYGDPVRQDDGTYLITFRNTTLLPCTKATVEWDGVTSRLRIPYIVSSDKNLDDASILDGTGRDCSECDVYVESGNTLTIAETDTIRKLYLPNNATLNVRNDKTLNVSILSLFSEGDQSAPEVNLNTGGSIKLRNNGELYYDLRIDESRYYWFSLPFDAQLKEISFVNEAANDGRPEYYAGSEGDTEDRAFFIKTYNGALRAADANGGALATTYWTDVTTRGTDYTMKAGRGYEIGLADQSEKKFNGQNYSHTSRTFRFTMRPTSGGSGTAWLTSERTGGGSKSATVTPSTVTDERNAVHAGWNLIGNPYMHTYNTGTVPSDGNIRNGHWIRELDWKDDWTGWYILDETHPDTYPKAVPYLTLYDPSKRKSGNSYSQVLASDHDLRPFEAVFVQVNEGNTLNFGNNMSVSAMPAYRRSIESEGPIRTGIMLTGGDYMDRTGFVLSEEYTAAYEIGADLEKVINSYTSKKTGTIYHLNLYSLDSLNRQLAFNGLNPEAAADTIPLGVIIPADGEYTFSFDADWYGAKAKYIESLELIDYQTHQTANLLNNIYSFTAEANQIINDRFALVIRLKDQSGVATDFEQIETESGAVRKIIKDGHLYILRENDVYNAVGAKIR